MWKYLTAKGYKFLQRWFNCIYSMWMIPILSGILLSIGTFILMYFLNLESRYIVLWQIKKVLYQYKTLWSDWITLFSQHCARQPINNRNNLFRSKLLFNVTNLIFTVTAVINVWQKSHVTKTDLIFGYVLALDTSWICMFCCTL